MSRVIYDNKRLIPAPFVNISKVYNRIGESEVISISYSITLEGTILDNMGSPDSTGLFWDQSGYPPDEDIDDDAKLGALLRKQQAIRTLFSADNEGKLLEIQSGDGSQPLTCNPKILSVEFPADLWYNKFRYSISLSADRLFPITDEEIIPYISDASETWSIEPQEERQEASEGGSLYYDVTYRVSHSLNAQGKRIFDETGALLSGKEPWQWARDWVSDRAGLDSTVVYSGLNKIGAYYNGYDYIKSEVIDKMTGQYSLSENWFLSSGSAIEQYELSLSKGINSSIKNVNIQGNIRGLELYTDVDNIRPVSKISNATTKYNQLISGNLPYIRCQNLLSELSNGVLHTVPTQETIGKNPTNGTINYSFEYNNRPSGLIPNAQFENISVNYIKQNQSFASVFVLGRTYGPVLQPLGTSEVQQKSLSIEFVKEPSLDPTNIGNSFKFPYSMISGLVYELDPLRCDNAVYSYSGQPNETYDPYTGSASYSLSWTYEQ